MGRHLRRWFWGWGSLWLILLVGQLYVSWGSSFTRRHGWAVSLLIDLAIASAAAWLIIRLEPGRRLRGQ